MREVYYAGILLLITIPFLHSRFLLVEFEKEVDSSDLHPISRSVACGSPSFREVKGSPPGRTIRRTRKRLPNIRSCVRLCEKDQACTIFRWVVSKSTSGRTKTNCQLTTASQNDLQNVAEEPNAQKKTCLKIT